MSALDYPVTSLRLGRYFPIITSLMVLFIFFAKYRNAVT